MKRTSIALFLLLFSPLALAHPGEHHGGLLRAIAHLLSEPDHLAMALIAVVIGAAGARFYRRRAAARAVDTRR
ncbi:MAG TPA: HupE/UreJ family protein [Thiobacillus sp.]|nr:HupE/UreJ family protein [Thiobacillus sp.]